jgi:hypothetical protein
MQALGRPGVVEEPGMHARSVYGNREVSGSAEAPYWADGPRWEGEKP